MQGGERRWERWEWRRERRDGESEDGLKDETGETDLQKVGDDRQHESFSR